MGIILDLITKNNYNIVNDWGLYIDFMEIITDVTEDFTEFIIKDYKERI